MSTTEEQRHDLIEALRATIGHEPTGTLMGYLPPVGWADVATKRDLDQVATLIDARFERLEFRFEARLHEELRKQMLTLVSVLTVVMGILVTLSSLFG